MHVYVLKSEGGMVKVGIAVDPRKRMANIAVGHPHGLSVAYSVNEGKAARIVEARVHTLLKHKRMAGEWFGVSVEEAIAAVDKARAMTDAEIAPMRSDGAKRQRAFRARVQEKLERLERTDAALAAILALVASKTGPVAVEIGKLAREGLGVEEGK